MGRRRSGPVAQRFLRRRVRVRMARWAYPAALSRPKDCVSAYCVKVEDVPILGGADLRIRSLSDRLQFFDPHDEALNLGISSAAWPLFGLLWPSARVLADALQSHDLRDMRILEIGCGLALPSLVAHRRLADVTASDRHPLTETFLLENLRLNGLPPMRYRAGDWSDPDRALGKFDLIIGSDVLYERDQPAQLLDFIDAHGQPGVQVMLVDPDRGNRNAFSKAMTTLGFDHHRLRVQGHHEGSANFRGHLLNYHRTL